MDWWERSYWAVVIGSAIAFQTNSSFAQITPDNTLGAESSLVTPNQSIKDIPSDRIEGGAIRGQNLLHSFSEFNINEGRGAYFSNPTGVENILTRVTGNNLSRILGTLGVDGGANLFLLNPNGIFFGANAKLDINGSFLGSTANGIGVDNQDFFNLLNSQPDSQLLTVKPSALFLNQLQGGRIETSSSRLRVPEGQSLLLVGGDINVNGGLRADGGRIDLAGLTENGTVGLNGNGSDLSLTVPENLTRADISVANRAFIDVRAAGGGSIAVNARNLEVREGSQLRAGIRQGLGSSSSVGGDITINATEKVIFDGQGSNRPTGVRSQVNAGAKGKAGSVQINIGSLFVLNGAQINANATVVGNAGSVKITAKDKVIFDGQGNDVSTGAFSSSSVEGKAGGVEISTGSLSVLNGAQINASTGGIGDAGSVKITAKDKVIFDRKGSIFAGTLSLVSSVGEGKAGGVEINTGSLSVLNGARLNASSRGIGDAGSVKITAKDKVIFDGQGSDRLTGAFSEVNSRAEGKAGGVEITTGSLSVLNGARLSASTFGIGDAGSVKITAKDKVIFDRKGSDISTGAFSVVVPGAEGKAGGVEINTGSLSVLNGAHLNASTSGIGDAGSVKITAKDKVIFDRKGSDIATGAFSIVVPGAEGKAGGVEINTGSLSVLNGAYLNASTSGIGDAGTVKITAKDKVIFDGQGSDIVTGAFSVVVSGAEGKAGGVEINTGSLSVLNGAYLNASTSGIGDAGTVKITAKDKVIFDRKGSDIVTGAFSIVGTKAEGKAGGVEINTGSFSVLNGALLSASTLGIGDAGSIKITAKDKVIFDEQGSDIVTGALSTVVPGAEGKAGGVEINTDSLSVLNGAYLDASTFGKGDAGSIKITAKDKVIFDRKGSDIVTGAFSQVETEAEGKAGGVEINTGSLSVFNGAQLSTTSLGSGEAGKLTVNADSILLDNQGKILSNTTGGGGGGDIFVNSPLLNLRNGSSITTNARGNNISGGNITIDGKENGFIVALPWENSDISANSQDSRGGNVKINNTAGIYGIFPKNEPFPNTSDITATGATSDLEGNIQINPPEFDPSSGLIELPVNAVDSTNQISNACGPGGSQFKNEFTITGRGGLPISPTEPLQDTSTVSPEWVRLKPQSQTTVNRRNRRITAPSKISQNNSNSSSSSKNKTKKRNQIVEATGWIVDKHGNIEFVAQENQVNSQNYTSVSCAGRG